MSEPTHRQPFLAHIQELRGRTFWCVIALLIGTLIGYYLRDYLLYIIVKPLGQTLYYTSPGGGFSLIIQLCLSFGIVFAVPVFIFHLIRFLAPIVPGYSRRFLIIVLVTSCVLVGLGVAFAYFISLPSALYFLNEFSNEQVQALISTDTYMSFVTLYLAGFAVLFQLPLLLLVVNSVTRLQPKTLLLNTKWVILGSFIIAAIITPTPDPFNQAIMAGPIIILYLASILLVKVSNHRCVEQAEPIGSILEKIEQTKVAEEYEFDTSQVTLVRQQPTVYKNRKGEYYMWKYKDKRSEDVIVTFFYEGEHEFVKTYTPEQLQQK